MPFKLKSFGIIYHLHHSISKKKMKKKRSSDADGRARFGICSNAWGRIRHIFHEQSAQMPREATHAIISNCCVMRFRLYIIISFGCWFGLVGFTAPSKMWCVCVTLRYRIHMPLPSSSSSSPTTIQRRPGLVLRPAANSCEA